MEIIARSWNSSITKEWHIIFSIFRI